MRLCRRRSSRSATSRFEKRIRRRERTRVLPLRRPFFSLSPVASMRPVSRGSARSIGNLPASFELKKIKKLKNHFFLSARILRVGCEVEVQVTHAHPIEFEKRTVFFASPSRSCGHLNGSSLGRKRNSSPRTLEMHDGRHREHLQVHLRHIGRRLRGRRRHPKEKGSHKTLAKRRIAKRMKAKSKIQSDPKFLFKS